ncbi:hypothetical protein ACQPT2_22445 [Erwinia amylovora]
MDDVAYAALSLLGWGSAVVGLILLMLMPLLRKLIQYQTERGKACCQLSLGFCNGWWRHFTPAAW